MKTISFLPVLKIISLIAAIVFLVPSAKAQAPVYTDDKVVESRMYRQGNDFQKDFLLFVDMLEDCHPAFAQGQDAPFNLKTIRKIGYRWAEECNSQNEFKAYLQSIMSRLEDGHSSVIPELDYGRIYPFFVFPLNDGLILYAVDKVNEAFLGKKITGINGVPADEVLDSFRPQISCDNMYCFNSRVSGFIQFASVWENNPYNSEDGTLTLDFADSTSVVLSAIPRDKMEVVWMMPQNPYQGLFKRSNQLFTYHIYPEQDLCYMEFNACTDQSVMRSQIYLQGLQHQMSEEQLEQRLAAYPRFDEFADKMFADIREKKIGTLVIDVRDNGGGNSVIGDILLSWLIPFDRMRTYSAQIRFSPLWESNYPKQASEYRDAFAEAGKPMKMGRLYDAGFLSSITVSDTTVDRSMEQFFRKNTDTAAIFKGKVFILQGRKTYSSAGMFVTLAYDNKVAEVIGDNSIYRPSHYGDLLSWQLPNTGVSGYLSHKIFVRPDKSRVSDPCLVPDKVITLGIEDLSNGVDPCEEYIMKME